MTCQVRLFLTLLLLTILAAPAVCSAVEPTTPSTAPANVAQSLPQQFLPPPPIFLSTYVCTFMSTACGGYSCSLTCNVGQGCICIATFGHGPDGCYVVHVGRGICTGP